MRIGHGFDVHAFGGEGPIIIGGVRIPYEKGLLAHSDGDVALHALTDALLAPRRWAISASCSPIPIRRLKAPIAANCCAKHGAAFRPGLYARQRRRHDYCPGAENAAAYSADARLYR